MSGFSLRFDEEITSDTLALWHSWLFPPQHHVTLLVQAATDLQARFEYVESADFCDDTDPHAWPATPGAWFAVHPDTAYRSLSAAQVRVRFRTTTAQHVQASLDVSDAHTGPVHHPDLDPTHVDQCPDAPLVQLAYFALRWALHASANHESDSLPVLAGLLHDQDVIESHPDPDTAATQAIDRDLDVWAVCHQGTATTPAGEPCDALLVTTARRTDGELYSFALQVETDTDGVLQPVDEPWFIPA